MEGHDTLGLMPTGGGKSLTFQVPAMILPGLTLVVTPLVSLMKDQVDNLWKKKIRAVYLHSGMKRREARLAYDRARLGKAKIMYVSPERLRAESFLEELKNIKVSLIVVDEAHCISQWGYDFRPSYLRIATLRTIPGLEAVPILALTASATPEVGQDIIRQLGMKPGYKVHTLSFHRSNLSYIVRVTDDKISKLLQVLRGIPGTAIVYVRSRAKTAQIAEVLVREGISATYYHAGMDPDLRAQRQEAWKENRVRVMVATNAFGMGIDKEDVRTVVHMDLPPSLEEYYQEAGRAGRDGKESLAVVIASAIDKAALTRHLHEAFPPSDFVSLVYERLGAFLGVAVGGGYNQSYEFNIDRFCSIYQFRPSPVRGALVLLTQAGYIEYVDEPPAKGRLIFTCRRDELYSIPLNPEAEKVLLAILRNYSGMFSEYIPISENRLAEATGLDTQKVYEALLYLDSQKILHYIPRRALPMVFWPTSREKTRYISLPPQIYQLRRQAMEHRVKTMERFVFDATNCRGRLLLEYFGEKPKDDCGKCDICRSKIAGKRALPTDSPEQYILQSLGKGPAPLETLLRPFPDKRDLLIQYIRNLIDRGQITRNGLILSLPD